MFGILQSCLTFEHENEQEPIFMLRGVPEGDMKVLWVENGE
jgi:hypothetical protein